MCGSCKYFAQGASCCYCSHPKQTSDLKNYAYWSFGENCKLFEEGLHRTREKGIGINQKELRKGNIFWDNYSGFMEVVEIGLIGVVARKYGVSSGVTGFYPYSSISPVYLTANILERCGAEKYPSDSEFGKNAYNLNGITIYLKKKNVYAHLGIEIQHLHTLQNYIYYITDKEIKFDITNL